MGSTKNSTPAPVKDQRSTDARQKDAAQAKPATPETAPQAEHLGATEDAVVHTTALTDDAQNQDEEIDPADEITPG